MRVHRVARSRVRRDVLLDGELGAYVCKEPNDRIMRRGLVPVGGGPVETVTFDVITRTMEDQREVGE